MTSVLVLGGSGFVGPAVVDAALARGWEVAAFNRGRREPPPGVRALTGDRLRADDLDALEHGEWDIVVDTWSGAPCAARDSAARLRDRARRYVYVSSCSVYVPPPPIGLDESFATVTASPDARDGDYPALKRGAELAVLAAFQDRALLLRAGLILGPGEDVGRLPWWLSRMARGGRVLCPGPPDLPLQYIDARDLADFALHAATSGVSGAVNTVSRRGHTTMGELLEACCTVAAPAGTELVWPASDAITAAGIEPWTELPIWIPADHPYAGMHGADVTRAYTAGLHCRPMLETVRDTWAWMQSFGVAGPPRRADLPAPGLDPERERALLG